MWDTGQQCEISGIYRSDCPARTEVVVAKGETFPSCHHCRQAVTWTLAVATAGYRWANRCPSRAAGRARNRPAPGMEVSPGLVLSPDRSRPPVATPTAERLKGGVRPR